MLVRNVVGWGASQDAPHMPLRKLPDRLAYCKRLHNRGHLFVLGCAAKPSPKPTLLRTKNVGLRTCSQTLLRWGAINEKFNLTHFGQLLLKELK